ncbi:TVP38/TMEM64 family protein [Pyxidicoccus fallax]|uniref:TVP38/TMEM64 family membrane protein n=1 Tax=Pyxidicoccus fallax TaxID=394095 RepID=A0A848LVI2_9BACT|nr:VTT domain-containing protein [Pyxidicoccus fallax]NMO22067.1 TVP38/TMEM64 family protein [Pyxidicoccus fallax]NPC83603.1 TVP38/TMEM64 family protein [Pyxidicoccus fallax]
MSTDATPGNETHGPPAAWGRALVLAALLVGLALLASSESFQSGLRRVLEAAAPIISEHPFWGALLFILLSALSAMLAFFSSALLLPVALHAWGKTVCALLLWVGWMLGGATAYGIARAWGRPVIRRLTSARGLARYEERISRRTPLGLVFLFQLAVPSEIPGYVLGLARYGLRRYLLVLALAELPYAVATVYLGASFLEQRTVMLVGLGLAGILFGVWAFHVLRQRLGT